MTFSEYYNGLYPYLSGGKKKYDFFDEMIGYFINEAAHNSCQLLNCPKDTKGRYIQKQNARKIDPEYARYAYSEHNHDRYDTWLQEKMNAEDSFEAVESWLEENKISFDDVCDACDDLLENIFFNIAFPKITGSESVVLPPEKRASIEESDVLQRISAHDRKLLSVFCTDYDGILEKCIASDQAEVWFTGKISGRIDELNEKWKDLISGFSDVRLQADILGTMAALKDFYDAMDPDKKTAPVLPIRKLRSELRNCYVKIHPDKYSGLFPYEAFIDDWNDDEY